MEAVRKSDIKLPSKEYFSDIRLKPLFSRDLIWLFHQLWEKLDNCSKEFEHLKQHYSRLLNKKDLEKLERNYDSHISVILFMDAKSDDGKQLFTKTFGLQPNTCELCGERRRQLKRCHIVQKRFFKNSPDLYRDYDMHFANILLLCANCHNDLDEHSVSNTKLNRLINRRKRINKKMVQTLEADVDYMQAYVYGMQVFDDEMHKGAKKLFKKMFF